MRLEADLGEISEKHENIKNRLFLLLARFCFLFQLLIPMQFPLSPRPSAPGASHCHPTAIFSTIQRIFGSSACTVACVSLLMGGSIAASAAPKLPDGTIPSNMGVQIKGPEMNAEALDKVRDAGFKWVRRGFIWEGIEKEKGVYNFEPYDKFVALCKERGLGIIAPMAFNNKLYGHVKDEPGRSAYAAWAAAMAGHFKNDNIYWEIWNEPNTMTFWGRHGKKGNSEPYAEEYTNLVKATIPAMRKAHPQSIILAGSVSNMWTESYKWMGFCFADGMLKENWDVWSVHPYGLKAPEDYIEAYAITRKLMDDAGGPSNRPWMNTERGFPVDKKKEGFAGGDGPNLLEYQAWNLVRQYLIDLLEGVNVTCWYEWGGREGFALYQEGGEPTPALKAAKVFIAQLSGYKLDKRIATKEPRDFVLRFTNPAGGVKFVAWTAPPPMQGPDKIVDHKITVPVEASGSLETAGLYGEPGKLEVKAGSVELSLTGAPQYLTVKK